MDFDRPVISYVDDFIGFGAGGAVPAAYYERDRGEWVPSDDGVIVTVLDTDDEGLAGIDVTGDGEADDAATLAEHGITAEERAVLGAHHPAGTTLWRVTLDHFTAWDYNWPFAPPPDARSPRVPDIRQLDDGDCDQTGSVIECMSQVLRYSVEVAGSDQSLHYTSRRAPGYTNSVRFPVTDDNLPDSLAQVRVIISVAGERHRRTYPPVPGLTDVFEWSGHDAYGREVAGGQPVTVRIGYVYPGVFGTPRDEVVASFGSFPSNITANRTREEVTLWQELRTTVRSPTNPRMGVAGWSLTDHHRFDPNGATLYLGDGSHRSAAALPTMASPIAGTGERGFGGDDEPATDARLSQPTSVAVGPDGGVYIADFGNHRVRRVDPEGIISTFAGSGSSGFGGDDGPATDARLNSPRGVAVGPDGGVYIADFGNHRVRRVDPEGIISTFAGSGSSGFGGDGGPATDARLNQPIDVAVGPDGSVYIADLGNRRVRRVAPDGIITTAAGTGGAGVGGDGGPAAAARFFTLGGVAVGPDASVYIAGDRRVRRVGLDGIINTIAGTGGTCGPHLREHPQCGDGRQATTAALGVDGVSVDAEGNVYIVDLQAHRVRRVDPEGIISTVAGGDDMPVGDNVVPATRAVINFPSGVATDPGGGFVIAAPSDDRVYRVRPPLGAHDLQAISSHDGRELYVFNSSGRHLKTVHALTGEVLREFTYDDEGRLVAVTDGDGNTLDVERDDGTPTALLAPFGQRTGLDVDGEGWLAEVADPLGGTERYAYGASGLLTERTDALDHAASYGYDERGRLIRAEAPDGGVQTLEQREISNGLEVTHTSAEGRETRYRRQRMPGGGSRWVVTLPDGTETTTEFGRDGSQTLTRSDGTSVRILEGPDPRFGMLAPVLEEAVVTTPGGVEYELTEGQRTWTASDPHDPLTVQTLTTSLRLNGRLWTSTYDAGERTFTNTTPEGREITTTVDELGRPVEQRLGSMLLQAVGFDDAGLVETITEGSGDAARTLMLSYDDEGWLEAAVDAAGDTFGFDHDDAGRLTSYVLPDEEAVGFGYDEAANLAELTPPGRPTHEFAYTPRGIVEEYVAPDVGDGEAVTTLSYDLDGELTRRVRPGGRTIDLAYDAAGRLDEVTLSKSTIDLAYDGLERLSTLAGPDGTLSYDHDGDLVVGVRWDGEVAGSVTRSYNDDLLVSSLQVGDEEATTFAYDGDLLRTRAGGLTLSYGDSHDLVTATELDAVADTRDYDDAGELDAYTATFDGTSLFATDYERDALGRIVEVQETVEGEESTLAYRYDERGHLTEVQRDGVVVAAYTYDANGNRVAAGDTEGEVVASYDDQDRLVDYGDASYTYLPDGHLARRPVDGETTTYDYDELGNLLRVTLPEGTEIDYLVDGANSRIGKKVDGELVQGLLYDDPLTPVAELDGDGEVVSRFVYGSLRHVPDYLVRGEETYRLITDHLGSVRLVVHTTTGEVAQRIDYDAFGRVLADTNPGFQPFGFAGGLTDPDTGLVRFGARDYDPHTGRWTAQDPILFKPGDANLYQYALGDPINRRDENGLWVVNAAGAFVGGVASGVSAAISGESPSSIAKQTLIGAATGALNPGSAVGRVTVGVMGAAASQRVSDSFPCEGFNITGLVASGISAGPLGPRGNPPPAASSFRESLNRQGKSQLKGNLRTEALTNVLEWSPDAEGLP